MTAEVEDDFGLNVREKGTIALTLSTFAATDQTLHYEGPLRQSTCWWGLPSPNRYGFP